MADKKQLKPIIQALLAAALFGASAPLSKLLLAGIDPISLAGFLYLGSGIGAAVLLLIGRISTKGQYPEAKITRKEIPWLLGAIIAGGIAAPIILLAGLQSIPAATASLLLNFETVATAIIAVFFFKESMDKRIIWAIILITIASILLSWIGGAWGFSLGAIAILVACIFWGLDNNFTRNISIKDPLLIVSIKGLAAGTFSILLATVLGRPLPELPVIFLALMLGFVSYGLSIRLCILSMRSLGAIRTYALFATAPFAGAVLSFILLKDAPKISFWFAVPLMLAGALFLIIEKHEHTHLHSFLEHTHSHTHTDAHHDHDPLSDVHSSNEVHSHQHRHDILEHSHFHTPDTHHRHIHAD
ncbi:MAG: DMT family transporter [Anaerolineaceae bacterium]|nr:DMT family transporter [Anaerolineaceae bacterium]